MASVWGPYPAEVVKVHDGDTVDVQITIDHDVGFDLHLIASVYARVRILGVNAPELSTPEGKRARDFVTALLPAGAKVTVESAGWDKYGGRVDGDIIFRDGLAHADRLSNALLQAGYAKKWDGTGEKPT